MPDHSTESKKKPSRLFLANGTVAWFQYKTVPSTMDVAADLVKKGADPWTVVSSLNQAEGRGTKGRKWISHAEKGLWCSIILPPPNQPSDMSPITLLAAESLLRTLKIWANTGLEIKYPNDVLLNGRKVAGILCESVIFENSVTSIILGMGVNLNQSRSQFTMSDLDDATSLLCETDKSVDSETFLIEFLNVLMPEYKNIVLNNYTSSTMKP